MKTRLLFIGSGIFAVPILQKIVDIDYIEVVGVVTQPDKPVGRRNELTSTPVGKLASQLNLIVYKPSSLKTESSTILDITKPDTIIVADYGQIIPYDMLNYPKYRCLNVHGSILPDLRGAVPIPISILKGYSKTGVSILIMTPGLDDGDILATSAVDILPNDTTQSLKHKLSVVGSDLLVEVLPKWLNNNLKPVKQDSSKATFTYIKDISKQNAYFDSNAPMPYVDRMIRAFYPWPIAWTNLILNNKSIRLKIFEAKISTKQMAKGVIIFDDKKLYLGFENGSLELNKLQLEGKSIGDGVYYSYLHQARMAL